MKKNISPLISLAILVFFFTEPLFSQGLQVTDIDGNTYDIVAIGPQVWMAENLRTTTLNTGTAIPNETVNSTWMGLTTPAYCWYDNDETANKLLYGALYNWYTVNTGELCPAGWRVPSTYDFSLLTDYLINNGYGYGGSGSDIAKSMASATGWATFTTEGTPGYDQASNNSSNFSARPGGGRFGIQGFRSLGELSSFWSSVEGGTTTALGINIFYNSENVLWPNLSKFYGYSVRCIKSVDTLTVTTVADTGPGSLRSAIQSANSDIDQDIILFNISGTGPFTIKPESPLPAINNPLIITGTSQPGSVDSINFLIKLDGSNAGAGINGFNVNSSFCSIKGLEISGFSRNGVQVSSGTGTFIGPNSIHDNGALGIDLGTDGITANDEGDMDTGPNNLQNYPLLDSIIIRDNKSITVAGRLSCEANKWYMLEFYSNKMPDDSLYGEGQTFIGLGTEMDSDGDGMIQFYYTFPFNPVYGDVITATASDLSQGGTSEFSKAIGGLSSQVLNNMPFHFSVNGSGVPNINSDTVRKVVNRSFLTWSNISTATINFVNDGATTSKYANASDGINLVSFTDDQYPFSPGVIAITAKTIQAGATESQNKILDADIVFNPVFVNSPVYNLGIADNLVYAGFFDLQSITTHEIGHILGLLHSGVFYSTMFFQIGRGMDFRSLEQDDKSWASYKYPLSTYHVFGSISGNITYGYDNQPVAGALVLAVNSATKDSVHSYSDASGHYIVPGLIQGSYTLYIEPLDGSVYGRPLSSRNISQYIYSNTKYTDYPGEYYSGNNESAVETTDNVTSVTVTAGSETTGRDFITNMDITPLKVVSVTPPDNKAASYLLVRFSEPVAVSTFTSQSCYLVRSGDTQPLGGTYTVMGDSTNIIIFTPQEALNFSTTYTLHITSAVTDLKGNGLASEYQTSFKTGADDNLAPSVIDIIPEDGADTVFVTSKIMLFFSEPMDKLSVETGFSLKTGTTGVQVIYSWDNQNMLLTVTPSTSLNENSTYTVTLSSGAKDLSGKTVSGTKSYTFKTVVTAPPAIIYSSPWNLQTNVSVNSPVVVDFSEPINTATVNSGSFNLSSDGGTVSGKFEFLNDNSRVLFRPSSDLGYGQSYTLTLSTAISDVSPSVQHLSSPFTSSFTTAAQPVKPHVDFIDPPAGEITALVSIGGTGFDPNPEMNKVYFSSVSGYVEAAITKSSFSSLSVIVPVGAISGPFTVSVRGTPMDNTDLSTYFYVVPQTLYPPCDQLASNIKAGAGSKDVSGTCNGATAYVTNSGSNTVSVIDLVTLTTKYSIPVGENPLKIDINPEGTRAYVTNFSSHNVSVIDLTTSPEKVIRTINVGINPYGIAVSPDGNKVYVANYTSENISVIEADPNSGGYDHTVANINTGAKNTDLEITPDAGLLAVAGNDGLKLIRLMYSASGFDHITKNSLSGVPTGNVGINPDGAIAYVTTMEGELYAVDINPASSYFGAAATGIKIGTQSGDVKAEYNGMIVYVTNPESNQVSVIQVSGNMPGTGGTSSQPMSMTLSRTINVGTDPVGLFINPKLDNYQLLVVNSGGLTGASGSLSVFRICCVENSASEDIGLLIFDIEGLISVNKVKATIGETLNNKLNDAILNIARGKTKTAINSLTAFVAKVRDLIKGKQIPSLEGNQLIDAANRIIARLKGAKAEAADSTTVFENQLPDPLSVTRLGAIYPNPSTEKVTINYEVASSSEGPGKVLIRIFDSSGRLVSTIADQPVEPGRYSVSWDGRYEHGVKASYGAYYVLFRCGNTEEVRTIMLIK